MPIDPLIRTSYVDPNNPSLIRIGTTTHGESLVDQARYIQALERAHGSGVHGWGIAKGAAIAATLNQPNVRVLPGVLMDVTGRHIVLAQGGKAEIGPNADSGSVAPDLTDVPATGAVMPTAGLTGAYYVSLTWRETFDVDLWNSSSQTIFQMLHTPWIRLDLASGITDANDDGSRVILGRVQLANGNVTALSQERRREVSLPSGRVQFWRGDVTAPAPNFKAENVLTGEIAARSAGGLEFKVARAADQMDFRLDGGNFSKIAFGADAIVARRGDGKESVVIDPVLGNIRLGTQGVEGDVVVYDASNRRSIVLDGGDASVTIGAPGNEGDLRVFNNEGQSSVRVDGNTGTVFEQRLAPSMGNGINVDARFFRIHGWDLVLDGRSGRNNRALVDFKDKLIVNFANDYPNGVEIETLHLGAHIRAGQVEGFDISKRPTYNQEVTLSEFGIGLQGADWDFTSSCSIGMFDNGTVDNFWWGAMDRSYISPSGEIVIRWVSNYHDRGDDWRPWTWTISWLAFRK